MPAVVSEYRSSNNLQKVVAAQHSIIHENIHKRNNIFYFPIYLIMFLENSTDIEDPVYRIDLTELQ